MITIRINPAMFGPGKEFADIPNNERSKVVVVIKDAGSGNIPLGSIKKGSYNQTVGKTYERGLSSSSLWADINGMQIREEELTTLVAAANDSPSSYLPMLINLVDRGVVQVLNASNVPLTVAQIRTYPS